MLTNFNQAFFATAMPVIELATATLMTGAPVGSYTKIIDFIHLESSKSGTIYSESGD